MLPPYYMATLAFARTITGMDDVTASVMVELSVGELGDVMTKYKSKENLNKAMQAVDALAYRDKAAMGGAEFKKLLERAEKIIGRGIRDCGVSTVNALLPSLAEHCRGKPAAASGGWAKLTI